MVARSFYPKLRLLAIVGGLALATCVLALMAAHKPAEAAFPGTNGKIAFASQAAFGGEPDTEIYTITADGGDIKRLTNDPYQDLSPAFSADGSRIAFTSDRYEVDRDLDIFTMNPKGTGIKKNVTHTSTASEVMAAWSPDGRKIAFVRGLDIFARNANGTNERQLTEDTESSFSPSWSPDGSTILFARRCDASLPCLGSDLWVMNADGTDERKFFTDLIPEGCSRESPDWSPDGTKVVFRYTCQDTSENGIYVVNDDGSGQQRLIASFDDNVNEPAWSPNGRKIAFSRANNEPNGDQTVGLRDIYVMRADGTNVINYTNTPFAEEYAPSWQPRVAPAG
jgi:TolB protein